MKLERQLAWPCRECAVRATSFCRALIGSAPDSPSANDPISEPISQLFFTARKGEVIRYDDRGPSNGPYIMCEGWVFRFHRFPDGRRQILSVLIPGDLFFTSALGNTQPDYAVELATDIQFCEFGRDDIRRLAIGKSRTIDALEQVCIQEGDDLIAAAINFAEPNFAKRVENFARGIVKRLSARNIKIADGVFPFPLSHADIADATGLTVADVNRAVQILHTDGIIDLSNSELTILDPANFEGRPSAPIRNDPISTASHSEIRLP